MEGDGGERQEPRALRSQRRRKQDLLFGGIFFSVIMMSVDSEVCQVQELCDQGLIEA